MGNAIPSALTDKSADGNSYLYVTYGFHSDNGAADGDWCASREPSLARPTHVSEVVQRLV